MNQSFMKNQVVLVTGGGSDLGIAIGIACGRLGARVLLGDIRPESLEKGMELLKREGIEAAALEMDVTKPEMVKAAFDKGRETFGEITRLVNSAGITRMQQIECISMEDWDKVFAINVRGMFSCCQEFSNRLKEAGKEGTIVNIASNAAKVTFPGQAHYNASKAAVVNMTQSLAKELAPFGINVNAVCPGAVDTEMLRYCMEETIKGAPKEDRPSIEELRKTWGPPQLGRLIQPSEVAEIVVFLMSDAAEVIRGQSINVDAGNTPY